MALSDRVRRFVLGAPKPLTEPGAFHKLSLVALLAWVGLGADGLSSSAYGPEEAFRALGQHRGLAVFLAVAMATTVFVISYGYSRIIEQFPAGGGGYLVTSKVLGTSVGVVSGSALLVDYVLTIAISIAAGADAIFSFVSLRWHVWELPFAVAGVLLLVTMNLRGVKESVTAIAPVFAIFIVTHALLLAVALGSHAGELGRVGRQVHGDLRGTLEALGTLGTLQLLMRAYALGGGTYTGIEAVSNGVGIMREPRVLTAKRTMVLMASSLALTASGLLLAYLLCGVTPTEGKTLNAVLLERVAGAWSWGGVDLGHPFVVLALSSEGALLFVAAQAGFVDGPRVMANMAVDSWLPHRFSALSERLTMRNGIVLMGAAALGALLYTRGRVSQLVVMYSINVFLTFTLSNAAMAVYWIRRRSSERDWARHLPAHVLAVTLCALILAVTLVEKFVDGGWLTLVITAALIAACFSVRAHYRSVGRAIARLDGELPDPVARTSSPSPAPPDPDAPVAILFVGDYSGLGRHALFTLLRMFPGHFRSVVFAGVAVADSGVFKGKDEVPRLTARTREHLSRYERLAATLGLRCESQLAVGTEVVAEAEQMAADLHRRYPKALAVAGQLVLAQESAWTRLLHNETAFMIQRRLQHRGVPMVVLPVLIDLRAERSVGAFSTALEKAEP